MKKYLILCLMIQISLLFAGSAKSVRMQVETKEILESEGFELNIILENFEGNKVSFQPPDFEKDLKRIQGPFQSQSTSIVNGDMTQSITLTYQFMAKKAGDIVINPAIVKDGGQTYQSNSLNLKILKAGDTKSNPEANGNQIFILATISNSKPYLGEMVKLDYTLYLPANTEIRLPSIVENPRILGFLVDEKNSNQQARSLVPQIHNGIRYNTLLIKSSWLTASSAGKQNIDPLILQVPVKERAKKKKRRTAFDDPFFDDDIFSGYASFVDQTIKSRSIPVEVRELPVNGRPASFSGAVGQFRVNASVNTTTLKANEAVTIKTIIEGSGNIGDIRPPRYTIPNDFEVYDPTIKVSLNGSPNSGRVVIEQICIPRVVGQQKITSSDFSFFNPASGRYETLSIPSFTINVQEGTGVAYIPGSMQSVSQKEVSVTGQDIRYLKKDDVDLYRKECKSFGFSNFYAWILLILTFPAAAFGMNFYYEKQNGNSSLRRRRKASAFANKKFKVAIKLAAQNKVTEFYQNIETTFYHYFADKFNISHTGIVLENIIATISEKNGDPQTLEQLRNLLNKCASVRYAPASELAKDVLPDLELSKEIISKLEAVIK